MNYALISNENTRNTRNNKIPPTQQYYRTTQIPPTNWRHLKGIYTTLTEAKTQYYIEEFNTCKWVQLICLETRHIINSFYVCTVHEDIIKYKRNRL